MDEPTTTAANDDLAVMLTPLELSLLRGCANRAFNDCYFAMAPPDPIIPKEHALRETAEATMETWRVLLRKLDDVQHDRPVC